MTTNCKNCGISVTRKGNVVFCSQVCNREYAQKRRDRHKNPKVENHNKRGYAQEDFRILIFRRDGFLCYYCGAHLHDLTSSGGCLDHVYPESMGGRNTASNLVTSCRTCNQHKHANLDLFEMETTLKDINARNAAFQIPSHLVVGMRKK